MRDDDRGGSEAQARVDGHRHHLPGHHLIKRRLDHKFGKGTVKFVEMGQPVDLTGAQRLAELDRFQFQQWALNLISALPLKPGDGKGAHRHLQTE
jgi:hypothetical protein